MATVIDLGFRPRPWQHDVFVSLKRFGVLVVHRRGGKTVLAILKLIDAALRHPVGLGRFAYIAPQLKQAKGIAWDYLKLYARKVPGTIINESELWVKFPNGAQVRLFGADNPDSIRGFYFDGVVLDEVAQMPLNLWAEIILPALADHQGWALFIGTPKGINLFSDIYDKALVNPEWFAKIYTVYDTHAINDEEVERNRQNMSENQFKQEMLCDFGAADDDTLIPSDLVRESITRTVTELQIYHAPKILGVDVAWAGGDRSAIAKRQGLMLHPLYAEAGLPEKAFAGRVANIWESWGADACFIDITGGYGGETLSRLRDAGFNPIGVKFSEKPFDPKFMNIRAEMYFKILTWLKDGGCMPNDIGLARELTALLYSNDNSSNRLKLEDKADLKARLGMSPDKADAVALTFTQSVRSKVQFTPPVIEFDPLAPPPIPMHNRLSGPTREFDLLR